MISDPELDIRHGSQVGRFVVVGELGKGGMGIVYAAHDRELDRQVALKVMRAAAASEEERLRMLREGQAMARITHPNVITVFEVGAEGQIVFLAQELLDGGTLGAWLEDQKRSHDEILAKFVAAGRGLAAAHAAGLVHRDFKPDNVLLGKDGRVRVSDFGLARAVGAPIETKTLDGKKAVTADPMSPLTRTGAVMGTPMFMAPEQHNGERADERSDQFAFAVALYQALYDAWPFAGKTAVALADAVIGGRIEKPPAGHRVPARLRQILVRGLATRPADRFPSMDAMLAELTRPAPRRAKKLALAIGGLAIAGGAVAGGYLLRTRDEDRPKIAPVIADRGIAWLSEAIERGQLADASEKYDLAAQLALQADQKPQAAVEWAQSTLVYTLRGELEPARARLRDVEANKGTDATAIAYADLAGAAVASATGELTVAFERSERCADQLSDKVPLVGAMCLELHAGAAAARGDLAGARKAYQDALAVAKKGAGESLAHGIELSLAELDLDAGQQDNVATGAAAMQATAAEHGLASIEARAWVLLARAHIAQAETQKALDDLSHVAPARVEWFDVRLQAQLALGTAQGLLGDPDAANEQLAAAHKAAEKAGYPALVLQARLARVTLAVHTGAPGAAAQQSALAKDARAKGYERIAHLAETITER